MPRARARTTRPYESGLWDDSLVPVRPTPSAVRPPAEHRARCSSGRAVRETRGDALDLSEAPWRTQRKCARSNPTVNLSAYVPPPIHPVAVADAVQLRLLVTGGFLEALFCIAHADGPSRGRRPTGTAAASLGARERRRRKLRKGLRPRSALRRACAGRPRRGRFPPPGQRDVAQACLVQRLEDAATARGSPRCIARRCSYPGTRAP